MSYQGMEEGIPQTTKQEQPRHHRETGNEDQAQATVNQDETPLHKTLS
jgi:hypothetical protein